MDLANQALVDKVIAATASAINPFWPPRVWITFNHSPRMYDGETGIGSATLSKDAGPTRNPLTIYVELEGHLVLFATAITQQSIVDFVPGQSLTLPLQRHY